MGKCMDVILNRRTIRFFKQDPITREDLQEIVNAGRMASSAGNRQPWEFVIVDNTKLVKELHPTMAWLGGDPAADQQPTAIIVVLIANPDDRWAPLADGAAAIQNMELAAWEKGIGSCWIGSLKKDVIREKLGIPVNLTLFSVLALGIPDENPVAEDADDDVSARRDDAGVLHVKKRKLEAVAHVNGY